MNATEYEEHVARVLREEGWTATVTPPTADGGVDVIADRPGRRLGVQVKMYGVAGRVVNQQVIHELYGAATAQECTEFMIATDGQVGTAAQASAARLGVQIRMIPATANPDAPRASAEQRTTNVDFGRVWQDVAALEGQILLRDGGTSNRIVAVDGGGVVRITSGGTTQRLEIEIFRWAVERLLAGHIVTRDEINQRYIKRGSSGVVLILAALPMFETTKVGGKLALRLVVGED